VTQTARILGDVSAPVEYPDWGSLINPVQRWFQGPPGNPFTYWYVSLFPALTILLYSLGWNLADNVLKQNLHARSS
jgi:peptide/nickel transport system permease protein